MSRPLYALKTKAPRQRYLSLDEMRDRRDPDKHLRKAKAPLIRQMSTWTVDSILSAQEQHERGEFKESGLLWLWMQRTSRLKAVLRKRAGALPAMPFHCDPASGSQRATPEELGAAALIEQDWPEIMPESTLRGLVRQGVGMGAALARVYWVDDGRYWWPRLQLWPSDAFYYRDEECRWYARTRDRGDILIKPGCGWFLWLPDGPLGFQQGSVLSLSLPCFLSSMSDTDWANYNAANATIVRKAVVPRGATRASKDLFLDQLDDLGRDSSSLLCERNVDGSGFDFEYIAPGGGSQLDTFERSKADAAKQITIEILGQDKTTDLGANGARAAVETLQQVEDAIVAADAASLSTVIRCQILEPWAVLNLGSAALAPWPVWEVEQPENAGEIAASDRAVAEAAEALETALQGSEKALDKLAYFERAGIPMVDRPASQVPPADNALNLFQSEGLVAKLREALDGTGYQLDIAAILAQYGIPFVAAPAAPAAPAPAAPTLVQP